MNRPSGLWIPLIRGGWTSCKQFVLLRLYFQASCSSGWVEFGDSSVSATENSAPLGINPGNSTDSYKFSQCLFLSRTTETIIENSVIVEEFQSSFEDTCRKAALSYYMALFIWNNSSGTVICCPLTFFFPFSNIIGSSFRMGGAAPRLSFLKACMRSRARLSTSLQSHCFLPFLLYSAFWMKINSRISKQKEKEQCYCWGGWKGNNPWASKGWERAYISEPFSALDLANLNWGCSVCFLWINGWGFMSFGAMFHNP